MVLAAEPVCICGVDVAAPQQVRRSQQEPLEVFFAHYERQFTPAEVGLQGCTHVRQHPSTFLLCCPGHKHNDSSQASRHDCHDVQWRAIRGAGSDDDAKAAAFRQHWSLKEVCCITTGALTSTSSETRQHTDRWGVQHVAETWAPNSCALLGRRRL